MEETDDPATDKNATAKEADPGSKLLGYLLTGIAVWLFGAVVLINAIGSSSPLSLSTRGIVFGGMLLTAGNLVLLVAVVAKGVQLGMEAYALKSRSAIE